MPTVRKIQMKRKQKQNAWKKRQGLRRVSGSDRKRIKEAKECVDIVQWSDGIVQDTRPLTEIESMHRVRFINRIEALRRRFKNERIEVLDEGAGNSSFARELREKAKNKFGPNSIRITRTDTRTRGVPVLELVNTSPERLVETFGKNRFHLVVSTYGGIHHGKVKDLNILANIIEVLKPGGEARIFSHFMEDAAIEKIKKNFHNVSIAREALRLVIFKRGQ